MKTKPGIEIFHTITNWQQYENVGSTKLDNLYLNFK